MAVWWPAWLCFVLDLRLVGHGDGLGLGAFWVLASGAIFCGVLAVISGACLAGALCAWVWHVSGCCGWTADVVWLQCFLACVALLIGILGESRSDLGYGGWFVHAGWANELGGSPGGT